MQEAIKDDEPKKAILESITWRWAMKMSDHALHLLLSIVERTERSDDGKLQRFWVPPDGLKTVQVNVGKYDVNGHLQDRLVSVFVSGSKSAQALKKLERERYIERPPTRMPQPYLYASTEKGMLFVEDYRSK